MRLQPDPPSWKIGLDRAPAGRERLRPGREVAKGCGESPVPAQVPGCHFAVTKAAAGLPPTSAGTSLISAQKHQGSHQESIAADEADKFQPGGRGRRGAAFGGWAGGKVRDRRDGELPEAGACLVPQFPHRALRAQAAAHVWVAAGTPLPPAGARIRAERDDLILREMSLKTDQAADEKPYCRGGERGQRPRDLGSPGRPRLRDPSDSRPRQPPVIWDGWPRDVTPCRELVTPLWGRTRGVGFGWRVPPNLSPPPPPFATPTAAPGLSLARRAGHSRCQGR